MTTFEQRPTAKIYTFPTGGRRQYESAKSLANLPQRVAVAEHAPDVVYGGSWYHQAALEEAETNWDR
jgi:hypothetical protein